MLTEKKKKINKNIYNHFRLVHDRANKKKQHINPTIFVYIKGKTSDLQPTTSSPFDEVLGTIKNYYCNT